MLTDSGGCPFVWRLGEVTSTLDAARTLMDAGLLAPWESVQAVRQTSGRGQLRRQWISPAGNIYATLRLPQSDPFLGSEAAPALSLMLAAAFAGLGLSVRVKWPNDLVADTAEGPCKVAGILMEYVNTDLSLSNLLWLLEPALELDLSTDLSTATLAGNGNTYYPGWGHYCYQLYPEQALEVVNTLLNPYDRDLTLADMNIFQYQ